MRILRKLLHILKGAEDTFFDENNERKIDLSVPGVRRDTTHIRKHRTGIYTVKRTTINYPALIAFAILFLLALAAFLFIPPAEEGSASEQGTVVQ